MYYNEIYEMSSKIFENIILKNKYNEIISIKKISFNDYILMKKMYTFSETTIKELYEETDINYNVLIKKIEDLKNIGIVSKENSKDDKRVKILKITDEGKEILIKVDAKINEKLKFIIKDFTVNEEKAVLKFLSKINQLAISDSKK